MKRYMVVERFRIDCFDKVYARFNEKSRMLPEGLFYLNSWVSEDETVCFQLMETGDRDLFEQWFLHWNDLVEFDVYPLN